MKVTIPGVILKRKYGVDIARGAGKGGRKPIEGGRPLRRSEEPQEYEK